MSIASNLIMLDKYSATIQKTTKKLLQIEHTFDIITSPIKKGGVFILNLLDLR